MPGVWVLRSPAGDTWPLLLFPVTIGREALAGVAVGLADPRVSRRHAEIDIGDDAQLTIRDLKSRNGTIVNGVRIRDRIALRAGDRIRLGATELTLARAEPEADTNRTKVEIAFDRSVEPRTVPFDDLPESVTDRARAASAAGRAQETGPALLYLLGRSVSGLRDPEAIVDAVIGMMADLLHAERAALLAPDERGALRVIEGTPGGRAEQLAPVTVAEGFAQRALKLREAMLFDARRTGQQTVGTPCGVRSAIAVPLCVGDATTGVLYAETCAEERPFDEATLELMGAVGLQAAASLEAARRLREATEAREALDAANEQLRHSSAELERRVEERTRELEAKSLEVQQAQKMEAIGRLAGGVAHDLNNLLTVVQGNVDLASSELAGADPAADYLHEIGAAAHRAADLVRQLLAFSRKQLIRPRVLNLNRLIASLHRMLARMLGEDVQIELAPQVGLGRIKADPGQIEQVLVNLAANAREAMPTGGVLTIGTEDVTLDEAFCVRHPDLAPGPHVCLYVADTGIGMDAETRARVFEPFFTTKGPAGGSGLGLSTVYGIVRQHGGGIYVASAPGEGATFRAYFPALPAHAEGQDRGLAAEMSLPRGRETILVVEDEAMVRGLVVRVLTRQGYRVLEAAHASAALDVASRHGGRIDLLLTDVVMPRMNGRELAEALCPRHPDMKVLYTSGYTADVISQHGVLEDRVHFLQKPCPPATLAFKVREVLDAPAAPCAG